MYTCSAYTHVSVCFKCCSLPCHQSLSLSLSPPQAPPSSSLVTSDCTHTCVNFTRGDRQRRHYKAPATRLTDEICVHCANFPLASSPPSTFETRTTTRLVEPTSRAQRHGQRTDRPNIRTRGRNCGHALLHPLPCTTCMSSNSATPPIPILRPSKESLKCMGTKRTTSTLQRSARNVISFCSQCTERTAPVREGEHLQNGPGVQRKHTKNQQSRPCIQQQVIPKGTSTLSPMQVLHGSIIRSRDLPACRTGYLRASKAHWRTAHRSLQYPECHTETSSHTTSQHR